MNLMFLASRTIGPVCAAAALAVLGVGCRVLAQEAAGPGAGHAERLSFNEHVRPILSANCFACHGPDAAKRQAGQAAAHISCSSFMPLTCPLAAAFARVAVANVTRPYPHKLDHLLTGPDPGAADPCDTAPGRHSRLNGSP
jgi:hypothetical protein